MPTSRDSCEGRTTITNNRGERTVICKDGRAFSGSGEASGSGSNFPSGSDRDHPSGRSHSSGGSSSYSPQDSHIKTTSSNLSQIHGYRDGLILGGAYHDGRKNRAEFEDNINYQVKGISQNINYYGFRDPKGIILSDCDLVDIDIGVLVQTLKLYPFNLTIVDFSNNRLGNPSVENLFYTMGTHQNPPKYVQYINLSNNQIGDTGASYIAESLKSGRYPATKSIDVSGNNITKTGYGYFVEALENTSTQDVTITLASTVKDMQKVGNEAMKAMYDFVVKGLRYAVQEHVKNNAGTKWDINRVRSDQEIDKWKDCKDTVFNIGMGYFAGVVKCASTSPSKDPYSMFVCSSVQGGLEGIAQPETLHCIGDINQEVSDACSIM